MKVTFMYDTIHTGCPILNHTFGHTKTSNGCQSVFWTTTILDYCTLMSQKLILPGIQLLLHQGLCHIDDIQMWYNNGTDQKICDRRSLDKAWHQWHTRLVMYQLEWLQRTHTHTVVSCPKPWDQADSLYRFAGYDL